MNAQIVSDLHIEYDQNKKIDWKDYIEVKSNILILAGDIGSLYREEQLTYFLKEVSKQYKIVFYIPGNHEYYIRYEHTPVHMDELKQRLQNISNQIDNLYVLDNDSYLLHNKYCIIGSTLWSYIHNTHKYPYYRVKIYKWNKYYYNKHFENSLLYIKNVLEKCKRNNWTPIIATHYTPSFQCIGERHANDYFQYLYATHLEDFIYQYQPMIWICGHTHSNFDFYIHNTRLVSNQKGKEKEKVKKFFKDKVIKIK